MRSRAPGWGWWGGGELPLLPSGCIYPAVQQDLLPLGTAGDPQDNGYVTPMCHPMPPTHHHGISMATATHHRSSCPCCLQHLQDYTGNIFSPIRVPRRGGKKFISNILTFIICLIKLIVCIINVRDKISYKTQSAERCEMDQFLQHLKAMARGKSHLEVGRVAGLLVSPRSSERPRDPTLSGGDL